MEKSSLGVRRLDAAFFCRGTIHRARLVLASVPTHFCWNSGGLTTSGVPWADVCEVAVTRRIRVSRRHATHVSRQIQEDRAARAVCQLEPGIVDPDSSYSQELEEREEFSPFCKDRSRFAQGFPPLILRVWPDSIEKQFANDSVRESNAYSRSA